MLERIDLLFEELHLIVSRISVKTVHGLNTEKLKLPTASFVSSGFCVVLLHTDSGEIGFGEPSPYGGSIDSTINAVKEINDKLKGKSLYNVWSYRDFDEQLSGVDYGSLERQAVIAALSQCCLDILGKQIGLPVFKILNPESGGTVQAYASGGMIYDHHSLDLYVEEAVDCQKQGFKAWKFRPSTPKGLDHFQRNNAPPVIDLNAVKITIKIVSSEVGEDFEILLDVGCRCKDVSEAIELANFTMDYNVGFIEEPLPRDMESYSKLIENTEAKISIGETFFSALQFEKWAKNNAVDIFQPDMNLAGMREGIKILSIARKYKKKIILHNWANPISNLANLHFASAFKEQCDYVEASIVYNPFRNTLIENNIFPVNGEFILENTNGFNIEIKDIS